MYITIKNLDGSVYLSGWLGFQRNSPHTTWIAGLQRDNGLIMRVAGSDQNDAFWRMMESIDLDQFTIELSAGSK